jgi:hypothetical protein
MQSFRQVGRWLIALIITAAASVSGIMLGVGLDRLAWETGFTDGDSGMEILAYVALGGLMGPRSRSFPCGRVHPANSKMIRSTRPGTRPAR